jgi:hypothetical protein
MLGRFFFSGVGVSAAPSSLNCKTMKLRTGLSQAIELPDRGSIEASCSIEIGLDQELLFQEPDSLHAKIKEVFGACREAVMNELERYSNVSSQKPLNCKVNGQRQTMFSKPR